MCASDLQCQVDWHFGWAKQIEWRILRGCIRFKCWVAHTHPVDVVM